jgi:outer membrane protein assembly factor BamB
VRWNHTYPVPHRLDGASPAVGSSFFCDEDGYLYRVDAHTGEQLWKMHLPVMDTPTIASDGTVYLAPGLTNQSTVLAHASERLHSVGTFE